MFNINFFHIQINADSNHFFNKKIHMRKFIFLLISFLMFFSCGSQSEKIKNNTSEKKKRINIVQGNYEVLQSENKQKAKETLIVVIDPHGDGKLAVSEFKKMTDNFNCTIIGLNDIENNIPDFEKKIENDINSANRNLNLKIKHIFIAGFSGGARMAFQYALSHNVTGVLMCGAGVKIQKVSSLNFPLAMIIGTKDFNFIEQYYSPFSPVVKNKKVLTSVFEGIHEWPPEKDILRAMSFLFAKSGFVSEKKRDYLKEGNRLLKEKKYFEAFKKYETAYKTEIPGSETKLNNLLNNNEFKNFIKNFEASLQKELDRNNQYIQYLNTKDLTFWHNEIYRISKLMKSKDPFEAASYARTKAYLGIAMYSFVNKEITNPWSKTVDKYLKIYEYLEPENPDLWFFNSVREKQKNNTPLSEKYIKRAFLFGFKDSLKAKQYGLIQ